MRVSLTRNRFSEIDYEDWPRVRNHSWFFDGRYAAAKIDGRHVTIHRFIVQALPGQHIDHVDCDTLNNRRSNLRFCNTMQNAWNTTKSKRNSSGFKGVSWHKHQKKWQAQIRVMGRQTHLGYFDSPEMAHEAHKEVAISLRGEFARF